MMKLPTWYLFENNDRANLQDASLAHRVPDFCTMKQHTWKTSRLVPLVARTEHVYQEMSQTN